MIDDTGIMPAPANEPGNGDQSMRRSRHHNGGLRKRCECPRKAWPKCPHSWFLNYKPRGGPHYRLSLDREVGRHIEGKTEAEAEATKIRAAILAGTFRAKAEAPPVVPTSSPTLEQLGAVYFAHYVSPRTNAPLSHDERYRWDLVMRSEVETPTGKLRLGSLAAESLTRHHLQAFFEAQRLGRTECVTDRKGRTRQCQRGGTISTNRCLQRVRAFYTWAIENDYASSTPFKRGTASTLKLPREFERDRRLEPGEEQKLLAAANPHLRALIVAALETCCRVGELLSLQWHNVRWHLNEIHLPAAKTKARRERDVPMTPNLRAVLEMRRHDPSGAEHRPDTYVFGNEVGKRIRRVKRAWGTACRQAGIVGLHFHDLRREAGSRMLEAGVPEHVVQRMLGHANLATTSRYLKTTRRVMQDAIRKYAERVDRCTRVAHESDQPSERPHVSPQAHSPKSLQ